jgi:Mrp family chromosome partitioning ATPase
LAQNATSEGLAEVLKGEISLDDALISVNVGGGRSVSLLRGGSADVAPPDFIGSQAAAEVFRKLADRYDLVILDLPPPLQVAYATAAIQNADGTLVVVRHRSRVGNLQELRHRLDLIGVSALGYVYTDAPMRRFEATSHGLFTRAADRAQRRTSNAPKQNIPTEA